jgi:pyridinium-3,5-bisthiocarboxylic acid mononucleotide nickel chelatase
MEPTMKGKHLHLEAHAGIAGDMTLGALFDLGVPVDVVKDVLAKLPVGGYQLQVQKCLRGGLAGTDVKVLMEQGEHEHHEHEHVHDHKHEHFHDAGHAHRHYREIRQMLESLPAEVKRLSVAMFEAIAQAEAKLHGVSVDDVAFHEVGAIDSIVDIVGTAAAVAWLAPASISATPLALGHGTVRCAHGLLPVPAPATVEILRVAGVPVHDGGSTRELTTPTGAAIVAALAQTFGSAPAGRVVGVGYGAGDAELEDRPNLLRALLVDPGGVGAVDQVIEISANLDDFNPEWSEHVAERLFAAGALDVWWQPVTMKKSRPATILGVLAPPEALEPLVGVLFSETSTIGVRHHTLARRVLERRVVRVHTPYGQVAVKIASLGERVYNRAPEYEDCRRVARERDVPLKDVYAAALAAAREVGA